MATVGVKGLYAAPLGTALNGVSLASNSRKEAGIVQDPGECVARVMVQY